MVRTQYVSEVGDRLAQIDEALGRTDDIDEIVVTIYRHMHTMKGAASAAGDEPMSWFCHGLEERLKRGTSGRELGQIAIEEVARWRPVLGGLLEDPAGTLATLRTGGRRRSMSSLPVGGNTSRGEESRPPSMLDESTTIRVPAASTSDRLIDEG